jgi:chorismate mutase/prephenate dehydrogenase
VPSVERQVVERWQAGLVDHGVAPDRARNLARWLVDEAVRIQESDALVRARHRRRVLVIGGAGAMGRWLAGYAAQRGHQVRVVDPALRERRRTASLETLATGARWADLIIVATPMTRARAVYRALSRQPTRAVVFDVLSVKAPLIPQIRAARAAGIHVTSVHPLFGPRPSLLSGHEVLLLDCGDPSANAAAREFFSASPLAVTQIRLEEHDELTAELQALPRLAALLFVLALAPRGRAPRPGGATPSFRRQLEVARVVAEENPELSYGLLQLNPSTRSVLKRLERGLAELRGALTSQDPGRHRRLLREAGTRIRRVTPPPARRRTRS